MNQSGSRSDATGSICCTVLRRIRNKSNPWSSGISSFCGRSVTIQRNSIVDCRLRSPRCAMCTRRLGIDKTRRNTATFLCEKMPSSTKPEVRNVSQRRQRTKPRPTTGMHKICEIRPGGFRITPADGVRSGKPHDQFHKFLTDRQTDRQTDTDHNTPGGEENRINIIDTIVCKGKHKY